MKYFFSKSGLIEHKLCMNNQVSDTVSGDPLVVLLTDETAW